MQKIIFTLCFSIVLGFSVLHAQELGYGFKAGLNFSIIDGPSEMGNDGSDYETYEMISGFHIGAIINFKFTDIMGLRTELMYSQKGTRYTYEGDGFFNLPVINQDRFLSTMGNKKISLNISNSYIDIPVLGYWRATNWLEVSAGASIGFLVSSVAEGDIVYNGQTNNGTPLDEIIVTLDYNYNSDEGSIDFEDFTTRNIEGQSVVVPQNVDAYADYELHNSSYDGNLFRTVDFGLVGGFNIFLNQGLSVGLRANLGLSDITNNDTDYYKKELDNNGQLINSDDNDMNLSLQASIGFSF